MIGHNAYSISISTLALFFVHLLKKRLVGEQQSFIDRVLTVVEAGVVDDYILAGNKRAIPSNTFEPNCP